MNCTTLQHVLIVFLSQNLIYTLAFAPTSSSIHKTLSSLYPDHVLVLETTGGTGTGAFSVPSDSRSSSSLSAKPSTNVDLITFDLDDTIFPVGPVVQDANKSLIDHLKELGYATITQESLIASTKHIRNELLQQENKVITYTELRKRAICLEINKYLDEQKHDAIEVINNEQLTFTDSIVVQAYDIWEANRHLAAEKYLYHDTIPMLESLQEQYPNAVIGAITNGKGNPMMMKQTIHEFFDFCVSGEDENVFPYRKPNQEIYSKSLECFYDLRDSTADTPTTTRSSEKDNLCWFHIGDDLANDVGASAKSGAYSIWADLDEELYSQSASKRFSKRNSTTSQEGDTIKQVTNNDDKSNAQPFWSTATKEEIEKREQLNNESMMYVAARIDNLSELPNTINDISILHRKKKKL
jgi:putative hydrolase of the HAD superfamily